MTPAEVASCLETAKKLAHDAGEVILPHFRTRMKVENKLVAAFDPVTVADRAAEQLIRTSLQQRYPHHSILGEEFGLTQGSERLTWVLDPIDGTRAFITGQLHWGTLIALSQPSGDELQPLLGVMSQPYVAEMFFGSPAGAFLSSRSGVERLQTSACTRLSEAIACSTHPDMFAPGIERQSLDRIHDQVRLLRFGGDCYNYCLLAAGHIDLVIEADLKPYDIQALIPIIQHAGGQITGWDGEAPGASGRILATGNPVLHREALALLGER